MAADGQQPLDIDDLGARAQAMIGELGAISAERGRLVRLFLTPEHRRAAGLVASWMRDAGLTVTEDALGTVRGHWPGLTAKRLLIGSHIDTVVDAGRYDGCLGVVAGILAAGHFAKQKSTLPFGIDILAFGDEEGSRFATTLSSSAAVAGIFDPDRLAQKDADGVTLAAALAAYGKDARDIPAAAYRRAAAAAYVEVHIEQGPVLEARDRALGVVTAIVGQSYLTVSLEGEAGHAGTVPMALRRDALAGAAELIGIAERLAQDHAPDAVATVGRLTVAPNAANVIAAEATFTLDLRSVSDQLRTSLAEKFREQVQAVARRRKLGVTIAQTRDTPTTACDPRLRHLLADAVAAVGCEPIRLGSGAGHDGQSMVKLCPVGMLFVRCRGGISHNPAEHASPRDIGLAVAALTEFIGKFEPGSRAG